MNSSRILFGAVWIEKVCSLRYSSAGDLLAELYRRMFGMDGGTDSAPGILVSREALRTGSAAQKKIAGK